MKSKVECRGKYISDLIVSLNRARHDIEDGKNYGLALNKIRDVENKLLSLIYY